MGQKIYKTMQGREVELDKLIMRNETAVAVGNAKVNARGDELGPGGQIIRKREEIITTQNPRSDYTPHQVKPQPVVVEEPIDVSTLVAVTKTEAVVEKSTAPIQVNQPKPTVKKPEEKAE